MGRWTAKGAADQEVQSCLTEARRAIRKALMVAEGYSRGALQDGARSTDTILDRRALLQRMHTREAVDRDRIQRSRRVLAQLKAVTAALDSVGSLANPGAEADPDLVPESTKEARVRSSKAGQRQTQPSVQDEGD